MRASDSVEYGLQLPRRRGEGLVSSDGHATILPVVLAGEQEDSIEDVVEIVQRADGAEGFAVDITGEFTVGRDFQKVSEEDLQKGELQFGLPAAMIILLLVFGTLVGALVPLTMAMISIIVALALVAVIGQFVEVNLFVTNMLVAMGLALGIDYSLFIVSRLREERGKGLPHGEAILNVSSTATRAVVLSGTAFSLALLGMFLVPTTILRSLALGAIVVAIVSIARRAHLPSRAADGARRPHRQAACPLARQARLCLGGHRGAVLGRRGSRGGAPSRRSAWSRPSLCCCSQPLPLLGLKLGASGPSSLPDDAIGKQGLIALERDFPTGATEPVEIVVDTRDAPALTTACADLRSQLEQDPDFAADSATLEEGGGSPRSLSVPLNAEGSSEEASAAIDRLRDDYVPQAFGDAVGRESWSAGCPPRTATSSR